MSKEGLLSRWAALAQELIEAADALFDATDLGDESNPLHTVRMWALAVMCRTANQFAAFRLLMENGFIVEARTMTRCCYENLFWLGGLKEKGVEFLKQMEAAYTQSSRVLGSDLLNWWNSKEGLEDTSKKLEAFIEGLKNKPSGKINSAQEARDAGLGEAYVMYRVLSNDAAHPSAKSLSRHVRHDADGAVTVCGDPEWEDDEEDLDTWDLGCGVLLMVCIGTNEVLNSEKNEKLAIVTRRTLRLETKATHSPRRADRSKGRLATLRNRRLAVGLAQGHDRHPPRRAWLGRLRPQRPAPAGGRHRIVPFRLACRSDAAASPRADSVIVEWDGLLLDGREPLPAAGRTH